ncbi:MAG: DUF58 domain-containing protein, partial [Gaiellaceae bacterium]
PLAPRRKFAGLPFGGMTSVRRGAGSDVAGSRPYVPGDDAHAIDWASSARLSSAHGADEFIVREYLAEEAPRVVVLSDRRPAMSLFPRPLPWLDKPAAMRVAAQLIADATLAARGFFGYLDLGGDDERWVQPRTHHELPAEAHGGSFDAPEDNVERAFEFLARLQPPLPGGTFVFVLSDFLMPFAEEKWISALERRWDIVPVVIQDPVWERSFPDVGGVVMPFHDHTSGKFVTVRLTDREAAWRREENEARAEQLLARLRTLDLGPVVVTTSDRGDIFQAFLEWADERIVSRGHWW